MNRTHILLLLLLTFSFCSRKKSIDQKSEAAPVDSTAPLWKELSIEQYRGAITLSNLMPKRFRVFALDSLAMRNLLSKSLKQNQWMKGNRSLVLELPRPDSGFSAFSIYETSAMDSALAARYPDLKTYGGQGIRDRSQSVRFDFNEHGFNAYIMGEEWFIQPLKQGITHQYLLSYFKKDIADFKRTPFELPDSLR